MYGSLDISTSGMIAQRTRLEVISANIANQHTILDADGNLSPYQRRQVMFAPGNPGSRSASGSASGSAMGVHVAEIYANPDAIQWKWDPSSPHANKDGYVPTPDIDSVTEQINAMAAMRAYEANIAAAEASKAMMAQALRLIA